MRNTPYQPPKRRLTPTIDRISNFPDSILCHILSFLPTKQAATTSILSKRWKTVRFSVLALDFDSQTFKDFDSFRKFIYSTMSSIKVKNIPIHSFSFKCDSSSHFTQQNYDKVFKFEMLRGVQNLNIDMSNKKRISKLPPRIFSFRMLQTLKLTNLDMGYFNQVDFPHLKTLYLDSVLFLSPKYFLKFLLGCPILEDLQLMLSTDETMENLGNALANLVRVRIDWNFAPLSLVWNANILQLKKVVRVLWTKLPIFSNVTHLELSFGSDHIVGDNSLLGLLPHVPKLQHLKIQDDFGVLSTCIDCWEGPSVSECLSFHLKTCCIIGYRGSEYELGFAKYIMQHSKVLDTMTIKTICLSYLLKKNKRKITCPERNQMLVNLSLCTMGSPTCKLLFE